MWDYLHCQWYTKLYNNDLPAKIPEIMVPINGVLNRGETLPINLKITPSPAIAYKILGKGNIPPRRLNEKKKYVHDVEIILNNLHIYLMMPFEKTV